MSDCVLHPNKPEKDGYVRVMRNGKRRPAHVWEWMDAHGPVPDGMMVCHSCDVRSCINEEHLFLGTHADNMADMAAKGRASRHGGSAFGDRNAARKYGLNKGEKNPRHKLSSDDVDEIRNRYVPRKITQQMLADEFGVNQTVVSSVIRRKTWNY